MKTARLRCDMSRHTETGLAAVKEIITLLNEAERSPSWNSSLITIRQARRYVEELLTLNLTVPPPHQT